MTFVDDEDNTAPEAGQSDDIDAELLKATLEAIHTRLAGAALISLAALLARSGRGRAWPSDPKSMRRRVEAAIARIPPPDGLALMALCSIGSESRGASVPLYALQDRVIEIVGAYRGRPFTRRTVRRWTEDYYPGVLLGALTESGGTAEAGDPAISAPVSSTPSAGGFSDLRFLDRSELEIHRGGVENQIESASTSLRISGNDCAAILGSKRAYLQEALDRGVRVDIMCIDASAAGLPTMLAAIDPIFKTEGDVLTSMKRADELLRDLRSAYPATFQYGYLPVLPAVGMFIADMDEGSESIKVELYSPKPWQPVNSRLHLILPDSELRLRAYFRSVWANYWNLARKPWRSHPFLDASLS